MSIDIYCVRRQTILVQLFKLPPADSIDLSGRYKSCLGNLHKTMLSVHFSPGTVACAKPVALPVSNFCRRLLYHDRFWKVLTIHVSFMFMVLPDIIPEPKHSQYKPIYAGHYKITQETPKKYILLFTNLNEYRLPYLTQ